MNLFGLYIITTRKFDELYGKLLDAKEDIDVLNLDLQLSRRTAISYNEQLCQAEATISELQETIKDLEKSRKIATLQISNLLEENCALKRGGVVCG